MTFTLRIDTDGGAFEPTPGPEIARILRKVAYAVEENDDGGPVLDVNGNRVGSWELEPSSDDDPWGDENAFQGVTWAGLLRRLPTLTESQTLDLKVDEGILRVWLARTGVEDGEPFENTVYVEAYFPVSARWEEIGRYDGDEVDPYPHPDLALEAFEATKRAVAEDETTCKHCGDPIGRHETDGRWVDENGLESCAPLALHHEPEGVTDR